MSYFDELCKAMDWLGEQPDTVFLGQQVEYPGNSVFKTIENVPAKKRIEMPVAEDMQMGIAIGMARAGYTPITIYPRMDFLLCATNQLVNHLDKYKERVIVRVCVGSKRPLDPGPQHRGEYTTALWALLHRIIIIDLIKPLDIVSGYKQAYNAAPAVVIEHGGYYGME